MAETKSVGGISYSINVELEKYNADIDKSIDRLESLAKEAERQIEKVESTVEDSMKAITADTKEAVNSISNEVAVTTAVVSTSAEVITGDLEQVESSLVEVSNTAETQLERMEQSVTDAANTIEAKTPNLKLDKNGRLRDENGRFVRTVEEDLQQVENAVDSASSKIDSEMEVIDNSIERATNSASNNLSHFQKIANSINLQAVGNSIQSFGNSLSSIGSYMTVGITAPIIGAGAAAVKFASDIEQTHVSLKVLLGSAQAASDIASEWKTFAATTPFQMSEISQSGKMLISFGESADTVTDTLRRLGDVSSGIGVPLNELALIYGKARVQNTIFSEELNELAGRGVPIFTELAKVLGVAPEEVKKLASESKITFKEIEQVFKNLTSEGGKFSGMMQEMSLTTAGKFSTALDNLTAVAAKIGEVMIPPITQIIDYVTMLAEQVMKYLTPEISRFVVILGLVAAAVGPVLMFVGMLIGGFGGLVASLGAIIAAGPAIMAFFSAVGGALTALGAIPIAILASVTIVMGIIAALVASSIDWAETFDYLKKAAIGSLTLIVGFLYNIKDNFGRLTKYMKSNWDEVVTDMIAYFIQLPLKVAVLAIKAFMTVQTIGKRIMNVFFGWLSSQFMRLFQSIWEGDFLKYAFLAIGKLIANAAKMGRDFFMSFFTGATSAADFQKGFGKGLGEGFRDALQEELVGLGGEVKGLLPDLTIDLPEFNFDTSKVGDSAVEEGKKLAEKLSEGLDKGLQEPANDPFKNLDWLDVHIKEYHKTVEEGFVERNRKIMEDEAALEESFFDIADEIAATEPATEDTYDKPEITVSTYSASALGVETEYRNKQVMLLERIAAAVESSVPSPLKPTTEESFDFSF